MIKKSAILAVLVFTFAAYCGGGDDSRRDATTVGSDGWIFEGWACAPDTSEALKGNSPAKYCSSDKPKDYLYMKFSAAASDVAIRSGRVAQMQSTCRKAAKDLVAGDALEKLVGAVLEQASGVSDGQSTGHAIVTQSKGLVRGVGIYDCCAIDNGTGRCVERGNPENWEQCQCVGYMKYPGGQKSFEAAAEKCEQTGNCNLF